MHNKCTVVFILPSMETGGVSKMLIATLNSLDKSKYDVDILYLEKEGELLKDIPKWVNLLSVEGYKYIKMIFLLLKNLYHKFGNLLVRKNKKIKVKNYNVGIAFQDGMATWFTAKNIHAQYKFAVIHTDFKEAKYNVDNEEKVYNVFEKIYCTSNSAKESFLSCMPRFKDRTKVWIPNIDKQNLLKMVDCCTEVPPKTDRVRLVTVARLSHEKGIDKAIKALSQLVKEGYNIEWYFIGDGPDRKKLEKVVNKLECYSNAIFLGNVQNPYGFIFSSDIYVQPSNYESYCIALAEARALGCAIVTSDFPSAKEQLQDNAGLITGTTWESLYEGIKIMLDNLEIRQNFSVTCEESFEKRNINCNILISDLDSYCKDIGDV